MKLTRAVWFVSLVAAGVSLASVAGAGSVCSDDPERCSERGASVRRVTGGVAGMNMVTPSPMSSGMVRKAVLTRAMPARLPAKLSRVAPHPPSASANTPGMGMLVKLSGGNSGDISWFPSRPSEAGTGASWVL